ncbi:hypothetical protein [Sphingobacterium luzhongxinii]|uniref:hypothetical protein n=1 Tax=Sphingobacterium luzhongxinii TaxID=2654181 RepID=UPI0013DC6084|nr:hypothetical protein [Sphingobacterium sp. xlx-73]
MKKNPFELNERGEKIDLSKPEDVALTIKRNEELNKAITKGVGFFEFESSAFITHEFRCFKCGNIISITKSIDVFEHGSLSISYDDLWEGCKCQKCLTKYSYSEENGVLKAKLHDIKRRN